MLVIMYRHIQSSTAFRCLVQRQINRSPTQFITLHFYHSNKCLELQFSQKCLQAPLHSPPSPRRQTATESNIKTSERCYLTLDQVRLGFVTLEYPAVAYKTRTLSTRFLFLESPQEGTKCCGVKIFTLFFSKFRLF